MSELQRSKLELNDEKQEIYQLLQEIKIHKSEAEEVNDVLLTAKKDLDEARHLLEVKNSIQIPCMLLTIFD